MNIYIREALKKAYPIERTENTTRTRMGQESQSMERDRIIGTLYGKLQTRNHTQAKIDQIGKKQFKREKNTTTQIHKRVETSGSFQKTSNAFNTHITQTIHHTIRRERQKKHNKHTQI